MEAKRYQLLRTLFDQVEVLAPHQQAGFLASIAAQDTTLHRELSQLLTETQDPGFDVLYQGMQAVHEMGSEPSLIGRVLGAYQLTAVIGMGGMGEVYRAERMDGTRHPAAVKVVRMATPAIRRQFEQERRILAALQHPNIAHFLDAGATSDGLAYLIMEYVEGMPVTQFCDVNRLSIEKRLSFFRQICDAVAHAHKHLVIHQDLKPSNILVTPEGYVKLLDFGIAKLIQLSPTDITVSVTQLHFLTPDYASPEQIKGETITTATDVFALGCLLYELLSGQVAKRMYREADDREVPPPSTALGQLQEGLLQKNAIDRSINPSALRKIMMGDLDTIVMKAMRQTPQHRYPSVEALSQDITFFLAHKPIVARRRSWRYQLGRFIKRNKWAVILGGLFMMLISLATLVSTYQFYQALHASEQSGKMAVFLEKVLIGENALGHQPMTLDTERASQLIRLSLERMPVELQDQPELQVRLLSTLTDVALAHQFLPLADSLAHAALQKVRQIGWQPLLHSRVLDLLALIKINYQDYEAAKPLLNAALMLHPQWGREDVALQSRILADLGQLELSTRNWPHAESHLLAAIELMRSRKSPHNETRYAQILSALGQLYYAQYQYGRSAHYYKEAAIAFQGTVNKSHPLVTQNLLNSGHALLLSGKKEEAESRYRGLWAALKPEERQTPFATDLQMALAYLYVEDNRMSLAEETLEQARLLIPLQPPAERDVLRAQHGATAAWIQWRKTGSENVLSRLLEAEHMLRTRLGGQDSRTQDVQIWIHRVRTSVKTSPLPTIPAPNGSKTSTPGE